MEIERKFLINKLPDNLDSFEHHHISQGYLLTKPVMRIRRKDDRAFFTYKGEGLLAREEIEKEISLEAYEKLLPKIEGRLIEKTRYIIPYNSYKIELDIFEGHKSGLIMAEVEFPNLDEANNFVAPEWFKEDVTGDPSYHNSNMI